MWGFAFQFGGRTPVSEVRKGRWVFKGYNERSARKGVIATPVYWERFTEDDARGVALRNKRFKGGRRSRLRQPKNDYAYQASCHCGSGRKFRKCHGAPA